LAEQLAMLSVRRGARRELEEAMGKADTADENVVWRIARAGEMSSGAGRGEDRSEDFEIAENGVKLSRKERAEVRELFDSIDFRGGRRGRS
jgi:hypothetical protein